MKYVQEYRDRGVAKAIAQQIAEEAGSASFNFMEFCGGHTHAIARYGIEDLLPPALRLIHGPGCPVCVLPVGRIDAAIQLAQDCDVTLCTYGDLMRVPGSHGTSLLRAKAAGADIRMVYSTLDAVGLAEAEPERDVVFLAIGFETTAPATALAIRLAAQKQLGNFTVLCNHVVTPAAIRAILEGPELGDSGDTRIDGFIGPAHVSTIIGIRPYEFCASEFARPVVIAGFEPLDVMQAILMLIRQINEGRCEVENQYGRAVKSEGNELARADIAEILELRDSAEWRGLGHLPHSGLRLREKYAAFDAERRFGVAEVRAQDNPACECGSILRGAKKPAECKLFGTLCTPERPMGSCMVSSEGACAAYWTYGRFRDRAGREP